MERVNHWVRVEQNVWRRTLPPRDTAQFRSAKWLNVMAMKSKRGDRWEIEISGRRQGDYQSGEAAREAADALVRSALLEGVRVILKEAGLDASLWTFDPWLPVVEGAMTYSHRAAGISIRRHPNGRCWLMDDRSRTNGTGYLGSFANARDAASAWKTGNNDLGYEPMADVAARRDALSEFLGRNEEHPQTLDRSGRLVLRPDARGVVHVISPEPGGYTLRAFRSDAVARDVDQEDVGVILDTYVTPEEAVARGYASV